MSAFGSPVDKPSVVRAYVRIAGIVQGVGFRPFIYQLAREHGLGGYVANTSSGVEMEIEGERESVEAFLADIPERKPPLALITEIVSDYREPVGHDGFMIRESRGEARRTALISPDVAVCSDCLRELFDPLDRRHRYPFINCTNCGPRYTIIHDIPYDRPKTSMACFKMCPDCEAEYHDPIDRRFHAQPNACPACGPKVWLERRSLPPLLEKERAGAVEPRGATALYGVRIAPCGGEPSPSPCLPTGRLSLLGRGEDQNPLGDSAGDPIEEAVRLLQEGAIVAVKGLGGFHLACDATNENAVLELRRRKDREEKPFALMVPDLVTARRLCRLTPEGEALLTSKERPIVLLERKEGTPVAEAVAPGNCYLGLMLPYTPLHYLLFFTASGGPAGQPRFTALVMTSGNRKEEPIAIGNREALRRLGGLADAFLLHDRDIYLRSDDSVIRPEGEGILCIRRSRGYVPVPVRLKREIGEVLAVGGHLKNTVALSKGRNVFLSQHIGDLENLEALEFLEESIAHLQRILEITPGIVAHDLHPDYLSTHLALALPGTHVGVQHHHAHVAACMAEYGLEGPVIGVALDGTGYGTDGHVWGGEVLISDYKGFRRAAHFREAPLPGGERAIKEPWRMALSHLDAAYGASLWDLPIPFIRALDRSKAEVLLRMARQGVNSPLTSSCGRLFDAVASLTGIRQVVTYEGQAAMELEMAMDVPGSQESEVRSQEETHYAGECTSAANAFLLEPTPLIRGVVEDVERGVPAGMISLHFHQALVRLLAEACVRIGEGTGIKEVVLSGGCFQNRFLTARLSAALEAKGYTVYTHRLVPPNDGGLALGQVVVAAACAASEI